MTNTNTKPAHVEAVDGHLRHSLATRRQHLLSEREVLVKAADRLPAIELELVEVQRRYLEAGADPADDPVTALLKPAQVGSGG